MEMKQVIRETLEWMTEEQSIRDAIKRRIVAAMSDCLETKGKVTQVRISADLNEKVFPFVRLLNKQYPNLATVDGTLPNDTIVAE